MQYSTFDSSRDRIWVAIGCSLIPLVPSCWGESHVHPMSIPCPSHVHPMSIMSIMSIPCPSTATFFQPALPNQALLELALKPQGADLFPRSMAMDQDQRVAWWNVVESNWLGNEGWFMPQKKDIAGIEYQTLTCLCISIPFNTIQYHSIPIASLAALASLASRNPWDLPWLHSHRSPT